jgi:periplasmic divalent cation tolerance protein
LSLVPTIVERTIREHSYEVPAVIALPVVAGNPAYIDWVLAETIDPADEPRRSSQHPDCLAPP